MLIKAYIKAIGQLSDTTSLKIIFASAFATILGFCVLGFALILIAGLVNWSSISLLGFELAVIASYLSFGAFMGAFLGTLGIGWLLFPYVSTAIISLFVDKIVKRVDELCYPELGMGKTVALKEQIISSLGFLGLIIALNLFITPLYLFTFFLFGFGAIFYLMVNGYLIGREYFDLVATTRLSSKDAKILRRKHRFIIWLHGMMTTFLLSIPVLGFVMPVVAAASMTHIFHELNQASFDTIDVKAGKQGKGASDIEILPSSKG